jgi:hypothetical protein
MFFTSLSFDHLGYHYPGSVDRRPGYKLPTHADLTLNPWIDTYREDGIERDLRAYTPHGLCIGSVSNLAGIQVTVGTPDEHAR